MSRDELDAQIDVRLMGACGKGGHIWETTPVIRYGEFTFGGETFCARCGHERGVHMTPHYSSDLNACARAERRMGERGYGADYVMTLEGLISEAQFRGASISLMGGTAGSEYVDYDVAFQLLMAPAEMRCRAMLSVLDEKEALCQP